MHAKAGRVRSSQTVGAEPYTKSSGQGALDTGAHAQIVSAELNLLLCGISHLSIQRRS